MMDKLKLCINISLQVGNMMGMTGSRNPDN